MINPENMTVTQEIELINDLYEKLNNAFSMHDELETVDLYNDIIILKTDVFLTLVRSMSSGRIASIINSTKYSDTDKAAEKAILFFIEADRNKLNNWAFQMLIPLSEIVFPDL